MRSIILILVTHLFVSGNPKIQGSYERPFVPGKNTTYGVLRVHASKPSAILFYLKLTGAAPAYNSGAIYGNLKYNVKTRHYEYLPTKTYGCKLSVVKAGNKITIKTLKGDCGFGHGVLADGSYELRDPANPDHFITRTNKKAFFEQVPVNRFKED